MKIFLDILLGFQIVPALMTEGEIFCMNFHLPSNPLSPVLNDCSLNKENLSPFFLWLALICKTKRNETKQFPAYTQVKEPAEQKHILLYCETKISIYYYFGKPKLTYITILRNKISIYYYFGNQN